MGPRVIDNNQVKVYMVRLTPNMEITKLITDFDLSSIGHLPSTERQGQGFLELSQHFPQESPLGPFWKQNIWCIESPKSYPKNRIRMIFFFFKTFKESSATAIGRNLVMCPWTIWFWSVYPYEVLKEEGGFCHSVSFLGLKIEAFWIGLRFLFHHII